MAGFLMTITDAGLDALVDAQGGGSDDIQIVSLGLSNMPFVASRTITALPGEFKLVTTVTGLPVAENIIHLTAYDTSSDTYDVTGFGLYLADGTLFAVYSSETDPVLSKAALAFALFSHDISFDNSAAANITFGSAAFTYPPASETVKGIAEIADNGEADAGTDDTRIMTPKKVGRVLDALAQAINGTINALSTSLNAAINALRNRTITGSGLVTGGGDLTANRVLTVPKASPADVATGTDDTKALTALALSGLPRNLTQNGHVTLPGTGGFMIQQGRFTASANGTTPVLFPVSFQTACFSVVISGDPASGGAQQDNSPGVVTSSITASGFSAYSAHDSSVGTAYIAVGR
ncbi:hypothetical protein AB1K62_00545 [Parasphingorhabdus sp. JC815]|uniref:gp53-like domain-containing protein n=1 Tax=Parasphingorhabdus sp. JC815 TaxID=3232140 RepID=UPI0034590D8C